MFSIVVSFRVADQEVSWERFASLFLVDAFKSAQSEIQPKPGRRPSIPITPSARESPKAKAEPRVVSINDAAQLLSISPWTLRSYVAQRKIASVRIGSRVLIPMEAINDLLQKGLQPAR